MEYLEKLEAEISAWEQITVHLHRFGGKEFRFRDAEVGHIHAGGTLDIPFPRPVRDHLLREGLAEEHRWVPNSGWITFHVRNSDDLKHATWLLRLSYLRYALKAASHPRELLERQSRELKLSPQLRSRFEPFVPSTEASLSTGPVPA
jgi:hypothetical protein